MAGVGDSDSHFAQMVMEMSLRKYNALPKKGKPKKGEEWTPLAAVLSCEGIYPLKIKIVDLHVVTLYQLSMVLRRET